MSAPVCCLPAADLPPDDLLLEVFLRLPPEPGHLLAASLVCRRWRRLVRNHTFLRRFRAFHRTPPVLGFFQNHLFKGHRRRLGFFPTVSSVGRLTPPLYELTRWVLDCRRGRVLLHGYGEQGLLVWDPMAGDTQYVSLPPGSQGWDVAGAVVCAAGHEDHTYCHSSPFQIIFLNGREDDYVFSRLVYAYVYSSETGAWGDATAIESPSPMDSDGSSSGLVGNCVYWKLEVADEGNSHILEFELPRQRLALIELPDVMETYMSDIHVMPAEDGGIGFAGVNESSLHFWSRRIDSEGAAGWELIRIIDLNKFALSGLPAGDTLLWSSVVAFVEDSDELFLQSEAGIFMIDIRSMQLRKVLEGIQSTIYPYTSFYTRGRDIVGIDDRDEQ